MQRLTRTAATIGIVLMLASPAETYGECGDGRLEADEVCDDGNIHGGDGCAANCTMEVKRDFVMDPDRAFAATQLIFARIEFPLQGTIRVTTGERRSGSGIIPLAIQQRDLVLQSVPVPGLTCACTFSAVDEEEHGPGNVARGFLDCAGNEFPNSLFVTRDHNISATDPECATGTVEPQGALHPGVCNGPYVVQTAGSDPPGSVVLLTNLTIRLIQDGGTCSVDPTNPAKGPDGIPCSPDDPTGDADPAQTIAIEFVPATTGTVRISLLNANNAPGVHIQQGSSCGGLPCETEVTGEPFDCEAILNSTTGGLATGRVALAFPVLDAQGIGDGVVTALLAAKEPLPACPGDCDDNGSVTIDELIQGVNIALGTLSLDRCTAFDKDQSGEVTVDELIGAVRNALEGCPAS